VRKRRDFLGCYRWLRQLPEFYKTKQLSSTMEDKRAQEQLNKCLVALILKMKKYAVQMPANYRHWFRTWNGCFGFSLG
jgi:hypothetical protein